MRADSKSLAPEHAKALGVEAFESRRPISRNSSPSASWLSASSETMPWPSRARHIRARPRGFFSVEKAGARRASPVGHVRPGPTPHIRHSASRAGCGGIHGRALRGLKPHRPACRTLAQISCVASKSSRARSSIRRHEFAGGVQRVEGRALLDGELVEREMRRRMRQRFHKLFAPGFELSVPDGHRSDQMNSDQRSRLRWKPPQALSATLCRRPSA